MSLTVKNLSKSYGEIEVLHDISFELRTGELMVILGPSGSGKSKTLEMISGIEEPDQGQIEINGMDVTGLQPRKRGVGFVFQNYSLFPHKKVYDNIAYGLKIKKDPLEKEKVQDISREMKVEELLDRYPDEISGGQQQRVALARALVIEPDILLFDEPLSSLDQRVREELRKTLKKIQQKHNVTTLYVTHDYVEAIALADRIAVLKEGRILQSGTPEEIFYRPLSREVADFTGMKNIFKARVTKSDEKRSTIEFGGLAITVDKHWSLGDVTICIRPESVMFLRPDKPFTFENTFSGRIEEIETMGSAMHSISIRVGDTLFYVNVPSHVVEKMCLKRNNEVRISLKKEKIHVLR